MTLSWANLKAMAGAHWRVLVASGVTRSRDLARQCDRIVELVDGRLVSDQRPSAPPPGIP